MKKTKEIILFVIIGCAILSCSVEEPTYDSTTYHYDVAAIDKENLSDFFSYNAADFSQLDDNLFFKANSKKIDYTISKIFEDGADLYLIYDLATKISILDKESFKIKSEINLPQSFLPPYQIAFHSGGTYGYISSSSSDYILQFNRLNNDLTDTIQLSGTVSGITHAGNYLFICLADKDELIKIDTRFGNIISNIKTDHNPIDVKTSFDGTSIFVLSSGKSSIQATGNAVIVNYKITDLSIIKKNNLQILPKLKASDVYPNELIVTKANNQIINCDNRVLFVNVRSSRITNYSSEIIPNIYYSVNYNALYHFTQENGQKLLSEIDPLNGSIKKKIPFNFKPLLIAIKKNE